MFGGAAGGAPTVHSLFSTSTSVANDPTQLEAQEKLDQAIGQVQSTDMKTLYGALQVVRVALSHPSEPPVGKVIDSGIVPRLVEVLDYAEEGEEDYNWEIAFESAWALTNVCSGTKQHVQAVLKTGCIKKMVILLAHPQKKLQHQAVWFIGNIAGEGNPQRFLLLQNQVVQAFENNFLAYGLDKFNTSEDGEDKLVVNNPSDTIEYCKVASWAIANLFRGDPPAPLSAIKPAIRLLLTLMRVPDVDVMSDATWGLAYLTGSKANDPQNDDVRVRALLDEPLNALNIMVHNLEHKSHSVTLPTVRVLGNICSATYDEATTAVVAAPGFMHRVQVMLDQGTDVCSKTTFKDVCWMVSNIAASDNNIVRMINTGVWMASMHAFDTWTDQPVLGELAWVFANTVEGCPPQYLDMIICTEVFEILGRQLDNDILTQESRDLLLGSVEKLCIQHHAKFSETMASLNDPSILLSIFEESNLPELINYASD